jgi:hypothetical protein
MKKTKIDLSEKYAKYGRHEINGLTRTILKLWQTDKVAPVWTRQNDTK